MISAGFEVSALVSAELSAVVHDKQTGQNSLTMIDMSDNTVDGIKRRSAIHMDAQSSGASTTNKKTCDHLIDSMVDWLTNVPENEL